MTTISAPNLHRQQLFHWTGYDLDKANKHRKVLSDELVHKCLCYIQKSLENGLLVKTPRKPEIFSCNHKSLTLDKPIVCFTEWSLSESEAHTKSYGHIGFGFPKRWVIEHGGQPVSYFRHNEKKTFLRTIFTLLSALGKPEEPAKSEWEAKGRSIKDKAAFDELLYLLHFAKMIRAPSSVTKSKGKRRQSKSEAGKKTSEKKLSPTLQDTKDYVHKFGRPMDYVEEREWRIVHRTDLKFYNPSDVPGRYFLPYIPGEGLFTLVVPDKKVLSKLLQCSFLTDRLFTPWNFYDMGIRKAPPVTILSHSDIGTF